MLDFGSLNIDRTYSVDHMVSEGETISCRKFESFIGGKGLNQAIALKRAGANVKLAGCVGDNDGNALINYLGENELDHLITKVKGDSGHAIIQIDSLGQNSIIVEGGANKKIEEDYIDQVLKGFNKGDYILLQNEINNVDYIVDKSYQMGLKIFFNPSPINEDIYKVDLNKIDCIILNEHEGKCLSEKDGKLEILEYFKKIYPEMEVVLTLGGKGGYYSCKETLINYEACKTKVVDTTGAGDTFCGYYIACQSEGKTIKESLNIASLAASLACAKNGASNSIPFMKEIDELNFKEEK